MCYYLLFIIYCAIYNLFNIDNSIVVLLYYKSKWHFFNYLVFTSGQIKLRAELVVLSLIECRILLIMSAVRSVLAE